MYPWVFYQLANDEGDMVKKTIKIKCVFAILIFALISTGCVKEEVGNISEGVSVDVANTYDQRDTGDESDGDTNEYYFNRDTKEFSLSGGMYFNEWGDVDTPHDSVSFGVENVVVLKEGYLSHIYIKQFDKYPIPENRISVGYFYVTKDKIIRMIERKDDPWHISESSIEAFRNYGSLPAESLVVCQNESIEDKLKPDYKKGWHTYLDVRKNNTKFGMYQNTVTKKYKESYFWEHFYWKKGKGLVGYDCGYKAGVDYFDLGEVDD